ncbi:MAG: Gfo/Idh/MocA family oxidoreductase [Bacteroidota bacterium]
MSDPSKKTFALIGAAGYVAPRHLAAIRELGHELVAAFDPSDSVGILDSYFPEAAFFTEFERFDRFLDKMIRSGRQLDYLSICSPNYLHDAHIRFGLRLGASVICEKPLVLNPWNLDGLAQVEADLSGRVWNILQLRLHAAVQALKAQVASSSTSDKQEVDLSYITSRGQWYYASWKGQLARSGGIATNIGIHFFDMLSWVFGPVEQLEVHLHTHDRAAGYLELEKARVKWFLSINADCLPATAKAAGQRTFRSLTIGEQAFDFSKGFEELHRASYAQILAGKGYGLQDARPAIVLAEQIRNTPTVVPAKERAHPLYALPLQPHPFSQRPD